MNPQIEKAISQADTMKEIMDTVVKTKKTGHILMYISAFVAGIALTVYVMSFFYPIDPRLTFATAFIQLALLAHTLYLHRVAGKKLKELTNKLTGNNQP